MSTVTNNDNEANISMSNEIEGLIRDNKTYRFASELSHTTDDARKQQLRNIISKLQAKSGENLNDVRGKITTMFNNVDKAMMKQPWSKLYDNHKELKINEFVDEIYAGHKSREQLRKLLVDEIITKGIGNKNVDYDQKLSKILGVANLVETAEGNFILAPKLKTKAKPKKETVGTVPVAILDADILSRATGSLAVVAPAKPTTVAKPLAVAAKPAAAVVTAPIKKKLARVTPTAVGQSK